jgi:hypothetical protein
MARVTWKGARKHSSTSTNHPSKPEDDPKGFAGRDPLETRDQIHLHDEAIGVKVRGRPWSVIEARALRVYVTLVMN